MINDQWRLRLRECLTPVAVAHAACTVLSLWALLLAALLAVMAWRLWPPAGYGH